MGSFPIHTASDWIRIVSMILGVELIALSSSNDVSCLLALRRTVIVVPTRVESVDVGSRGIIERITFVDTVHLSDSVS
jgi:hypothetical protein